MSELATKPPLFADLALSRRLERAEGQGNASFVETRTRLFSESGACWIDVAGTFAMYDGVNSPVTQTFALGLFEKASAADLDVIEEFFRVRGAPVCHEVSPLADPALLGLLSERGYRPIELTSVMYRPLQRGLAVDAPNNDRIRVRCVAGDDRELWAQTSIQGWSEFREVADELPALMRVSAARRDAQTFLAELDGRPIAAGALGMCDGVAVLAGAGTIPEARRQGAQLALLESRLRFAADNGCDLAMMGAQPGSASQRNAERQRFRIAYTRIKWRLTQGNAR